MKAAEERKQEEQLMQKTKENVRTRGEEEAEIEIKRYKNIERNEGYRRTGNWIKRESEKQMEKREIEHCIR